MPRVDDYTYHPFGFKPSRYPRKLDGFAARLRQARLRQGLTQEQLAQKAGVSAGFLSRVERGHAQPAWDNIIRLAEALSVTTGYLTTGYQKS